jgi:hypothetical protein
VRKQKVPPPKSASVLRFDRKAVYRTGDAVPESGIYRVSHGSHRLPHEVTLLQHQTFPRCCKCATLVVFEPVALAPTLTERRGHIVLYELPELEEDNAGLKSA